MDTAANIRVKVLFFGAVADAVGSRVSELELPSGSKSNAAFERILREHSSLSNRKLLFAVNQNYSTGNEALQAGDELAVFTAVSGG